MERSEFAELTAEDARTEAATDPDEGRQEAWLELAAAIDMSHGTTAGETRDQVVNRLYDSTGAAQAEITMELLARSLGEDREVRSEERSDDNSESEAPKAPEA